MPHVFPISVMLQEFVGQTPGRPRADHLKGGALHATIWPDATKLELSDLDGIRSHAGGGLQLHTLLCSLSGHARCSVGKLTPFPGRRVRVGGRVKCKLRNTSALCASAKAMRFESDISISLLRVRNTCQPLVASNAASRRAQSSVKSFSYW